MKHDWSVGPDEAKIRLDVFLTERMPEMTRSHIAKLLKQGTGTVNGKPASVHTFLKSGDAVAFSDEPATTEGGPDAEIPPLVIVAETPGYLVINKPVGVLVHPDAKHEHGTMVDAILKFDPKIAKIGEEPMRPGIVHRLDKDVGGLMVVARTQDAFDSLKKQFATHSMEKRYLALVAGTVAQDEGEIKFRIARSKTRGRMAARPVHEEEGRAAWTHFKTLKRLRTASLLELDIVSGRTHQIRVHLLAIGHPVLGDPLYAPKETLRLLPVPKLMLQCVHLGFIDPGTNERVAYDLDATKEFENILNGL